MPADPADFPPPPSPQPETFFQASKSQAVRAAEQLRDAASSKVQQFRGLTDDVADQFRFAAGGPSDTFRETGPVLEEPFQDPAGTQWAEARDHIRDWQTELEAYVRTHPTKSIIATFGLGLALGLLLRR